MPPACPHVTQARPASHQDDVHREECTRCYCDQDTPEGVYVCLTCFDCGCEGHISSHATMHDHPLQLSVRRVEKNPAEGDTGTSVGGGGGDGGSGEERPSKITKLAIGVEGGAPSDAAVPRDTVYAVRCTACSVSWDGSDPAVAPLVAGVRDAAAADKKGAVEAWELELTACEHTLCLDQPETVPTLDATAMVKCGDCDLTRNLWLCLSCGKLLCGRKNWDGSGGNGHALEHGAATGHHVVVKMGTITPEGKADVYCYACDDERIDPELPRHLNRFGLAVEEQKVTEKSLAELNLEFNIAFDFSMTTDDGVPLEPLCGPGLVGFRNIGNTCYIASALQSLFTVPEIADAYLNGDPGHGDTCRGPHASCWRCQMRKVARGVVSGEDPYAIRWESQEDHGKGQVGVSPAMIKALVAGDHPEFRTLQQQDSFEFLQHMIQVMVRKERAEGKGIDPGALLGHRLEQRLQCTKCAGVRYTVEPTQHTLSAAIPLPDGYRGEEKGKESTVPPVPFLDLLTHTFAPVAVDMHCPKCNESTLFQKSTSFRTLPDVLAVRAERFRCWDGWVPRRVGVPISLNPATPLRLCGGLIGSGPSPGEDKLPDGGGSSGNSAAEQSPEEIYPEAMATLTGMGFPPVRCGKALKATAGNVEAAMEWIMARMDEPGIDDPEPQGGGGGGGGGAPAAADPEAIASLVSMGFTDKRAARALRETGGNVEASVEWLFSHMDDGNDDVDQPGPGAGTGGAPSGDQNGGSSAEVDDVPASGPADYELVAVIAHKGTSVHAGHYVAYAKRGGRWVLFNDRRVADSGPVIDTAVSRGYVYLFKRVKAE